MGRVRQATVMVHKRRRSRRRRRTLIGVKAMVVTSLSLRRQGLQSSSSPPSSTACLHDDRALSPPRFARFITTATPHFSLWNPSPSPYAMTFTSPLFSPT
ncbi:hypothetical protein AMTR_s00025p00089470 [Amborella trichopoda]|uniref:Uncharacterized protein n=1 Tax=Amborella trichopoda TaxID=13333 RepID=W1PW62_AMBTC|nr:hypothetical protein AMTR_s00025p00089470 [Amborella trichopoda]